jgi:hypothetical protein
MFCSIFRLVSEYARPLSIAMAGVRSVLPEPSGQHYKE